MTALQIPPWPDTVATCGNTELVACRKTAFLCSRDYPAAAVLRAFDWAKAMRENGECVMSGFHSALERDVLDILLAGQQPLILVTARGLPKRHPAAIRHALEQERLLIASPFPASVTRMTAETARQRNAFIFSVADRIVIGYAQKEGALAEALRGFSADKEIIRLAG